MTGAHRPAGEQRPERGPSLRVQQKARTRENLRDAAMELFADQGYARTTVDDITSRVGCSRATFYLHFETKARIVAEVHESTIMAETLEFYRRLDASSRPTEPELRAWLDDALDFFERHHRTLRVCDEAYSTEPVLAGLAPSIALDRCAEVMPRYLDRWSGVSRPHATLRLGLLILQLAQFARLWVEGHWPVKRDEALDVLLDLWWNGLYVLAARSD